MSKRQKKKHAKNSLKIIATPKTTDQMESKGPLHTVSKVQPSTKSKKRTLFNVLSILGAFFVGAATVGTFILPIISRLNPKIRDFGVSGRQVAVRNQNGEIIGGPKLYGEEGWTINSSAQHNGVLVFSVGNKLQNKNQCIAVDNHLKALFEWTFDGESHYKDFLHRFSCSFVNRVSYGHKYFYVYVFNDEFYSSAIIILDAKGTKRGHLWHLGHVYQAEQLGDSLICWGKNNSFQYSRRALAPGTDETLLHNTVVFSVDLNELIEKGELYGPTGMRRNPDGSIRFKPLGPSPHFRWYYLFDSLTGALDEYLSPKPDSGLVEFTTPERWTYTFNNTSNSFVMTAPLANHTTNEWKPVMVAPTDETHEVQTFLP